MSKVTGSLLQAHGRLWYDDSWYRAAWILWPQCVGLLILLAVWAHPGAAPWGKPDQGTPAKAADQTDILAECKTAQDYNQRVTACSAQIASGKLKGDQLGDAYHMRGWAYYSLKQSQSAMQDYNQAISLSPNNPDFYNDRGVLSQDLGNKESALRDFNQTTSLKSDYALGYANQGWVLISLNRLDDAMTALSTAIRLNPNLPWAYENRADLYERKSNWRPLYDDATKLIELSPKNRLGYEYRGRAYLEAGQYQPAISDFTKSLSIEANIYSYRLRGRSYYFLNQFDKATADYDAALRLDAKDATTLSFIEELKRRKATNEVAADRSTPNRTPSLGDSYAGELSDFGIPPQSDLKQNVGSPTPLTIPGARRVTTAEVFKHLDTDTILIDVLRDNSGGHFTLPGAIYIPGAGDPGTFRDRIQRKLSPVLSQLTLRNADRPLLFYCEGAKCWESYNAALRAMQLGYHNVMWYRGGLASWKEANLKIQPAAAIHDLDKQDAR